MYCDMSLVINYSLLSHLAPWKYSVECMKLTLKAMTKEENKE